MRNTESLLLIMINLITMKKHLDFRTLVSRLIVTVVMCLPAWGIPVLAQEAESYAVFDAESATLTFRHDAAKPEGAYALNEGSERPGWSLLLPLSRRWCLMHRFQRLAPQLAEAGSPAAHR